MAERAKLVFRDSDPRYKAAHKALYYAGFHRDRKRIVAVVLQAADEAKVSPGPAGRASREELEALDIAHKALLERLNLAASEDNKILMAFNRARDRLSPSGEGEERESLTATLYRHSQAEIEEALRSMGYDGVLHEQGGQT